MKMQRIVRRVRYSSLGPLFASQSEWLVPLPSAGTDRSGMLVTFMKGQRSQSVHALSYMVDQVTRIPQIYC